jgi:transcriptional regulator with XRE-family HTH domain
MFGQVVRAHRRRLGLTQEELAGRAGVGLRTVRDIETGRVGRPRQTTVRRLAEVFGLRGVERGRFNELAEPAEVLLTAGAVAPSELAALREETHRLSVENEVLRQVAAHFARAQSQPR